MLTRLYFPFRRDSSFCSADSLETLEFPPERYGEALSSEGSFPGRTCPGPRPPTHHRQVIAVLLSPLPHPTPPRQLFTPPPLSTHSQHPQLQGLFLPPGPIPFKAAVIKHESSGSPGDIWQRLETFLIVMTQGGGQCTGQPRTHTAKKHPAPDVNSVKVEKPSFKGSKERTVGLMS